MMSRYLLLFLGQGLNFLVAIVNIRAASKGKVAVTMASDFVFCAINFVLIQKVAAAQDWRELLAYAAGGSVGSACAIYLTRHWDK